MRHLIFFSLVLFSAFSSAVMNGRNANLSLSKQTVWLRIEEAKLSCTAVVIHPHLLLTAGHCTGGVHSSRPKLEISNDLETNSIKTIRTLKWSVLPGYRESDIKQTKDIQFDLAYIVTRENLLEVLGLSLNDLPSLILSVAEQQDILDKVTNQAMAFGYGKYSLNGLDRMKKEISLDTYFFPEENFIQSTSLENKVGLCTGDSGGGLFYFLDGVLHFAGILSGISGEKGCGHSATISVHVSPIRRWCWIQRHSGIQLSEKLVCD